ncbi:UPF0058 family protein [Halorussus gelatinilyticus]|uniref:UPF0058 family protein n=1 Tax=Halorussus gelatinilyticus TaxID=2937524 RepID=A0A8U0IIG1_9EURY|nr:UPF0058 family protein [Halorussus gelatinilyticus]UPV99868.1 UPF0058 family protein [Halorussus gelatinilyticus]
MQKAELIYLHALLAKTHDYLAVRHDLPETFEGYESDGVGPYQIQRRKDEHETAVGLLAERLGDEVRAELRGDSVAEPDDDAGDEPRELELREA